MAEGQADPGETDLRYEVAISELRDRTRDGARRPRLVADENAEYGFQRNCLGLRPLDIPMAFAVLCASVILAAAGSAAFLLSAGVSVVALAFWLLVVRPDWVRLAADRYAVRPLETVEALGLDS